MLDALRLAGGFLSVLPVRAGAEPDRRTAGRAMVLAPLAVVPLGVGVGLLVLVAQLVGLSALVRAVLVVGALALGTRAIHLDGLADTVDGFGASWDRERALAVMRRGDVGPMGAVALLVVLGLQVAGLATLPYAARGALAVALLVCASRCALVLVCRRGVPAARPDGLGRVVAGSVGPLGVAVGTVLLVALATAAATTARQPWWQGVVAGVLAAVVVLLVVRHAVQRLGGVSGDVMGAAVEAAFATLLVVLAARP